MSTISTCTKTTANSANKKKPLDTLIIKMETVKIEPQENPKQNTCCESVCSNHVPKILFLDTK